MTGLAIAEEQVLTLPRNEVICADVLDGLRGLPDESVQVVCTSPPYWRQRAYEGDQVRVWPKIPSWNCAHRWGREQQRRGVAGSPDKEHRTLTGGAPHVDAATHGTTSEGAFCERCGAWRGALGQEPTFGMFLEHIVLIFREVRRVLRPDGNLFLNMGDAYAGSGKGFGRDKSYDGDLQATNRGSVGVRPPAWGRSGFKSKDLIGMPWAVAFALRDDGWWLRRDHFWLKKNPMPNSQTDRCTTSHEYLFQLTKKARYAFDADAIREPHTALGRPPGNKSRMYIDRDTEHLNKSTSGGEKRRPSQDQSFHASGRMKRSVWEIELEDGDEDYCPHCGGPQTGMILPLATEPSNYEFCNACKRLYVGGEKKRIKQYELDGEKVRECSCGATDGWVAHFATMPRELVRPCVKAGSSEAGCCAECGAPRRRIVEKELVKQYECRHGGFNAQGTSDGMVDMSESWSPGTNKATTLGFSPTCDCATDETAPCVILDPFGGSGTTGIVAVEEGRDYVLIDVSEEYCELARARIARATAQPRFALEPQEAPQRVEAVAMEF